MNGARALVIEALAKHLYGREQTTPASAGMRASEVLFIVEQMTTLACHDRSVGTSVGTPERNRRSEG